MLIFLIIFLQRNVIMTKLIMNHWLSGWHWGERHHWLEASGVPFVVWTDHKNIEYIKASKRLNSWKARRMVSPMHFHALLRPRAPRPLQIPFSHLLRWWQGYLGRSRLNSTQICIMPTFPHSAQRTCCLSLNAHPPVGSLLKSCLPPGSFSNSGIIYTAVLVV